MRFFKFDISELAAISDDASVGVSLNDDGSGWGAISPSAILSDDRAPEISEEEARKIWEAAGAPPPSF